MSKRTDISQQIRKYLNGKLDARAMHRLEKEAQNDPFLMEALEGYEQSGKDQRKNLADVDLRLHDRISKKERRIIPFRIIAIAASVLIALTIGGLWLRKESAVKVENRTVKLTKPQKPAPVNKPTNTDTIKSIIQASPAINRVAKNKPHKIKQEQPVLAANAEVKTPPPAVSTLAAAAIPPKKFGDSVALNEVVVTGYGTQKKTVITGDATEKNLTYSTSTITPPNNALEGKVAGVDIAPGDNKTITGIVKDETGQPIPGVTVRVKGTGIGTQTNSAGKFTLTAVPPGSTLVLAFVGYQSQQLPLDKKNYLAIAMQPSGSELAEVVVTGAPKTKDGEEAAFESAHPANGWSDFKKYLKDNAISPYGKEGVVKITFTVTEYGMLTDLKVKKSLSPETDSLAIKLIETGPRWISNNYHQPEKVTVRVRFIKAK